MTAQYLSILVNELIALIGDMIDSGFANSINLGVICIFGIINSIKIVLYAVYNYGIYYYRLTGKRAKAGLCVNIIMSGISSIIILLGNRFITDIFTLEEQYHPLLHRCIIITFSFFIFEAVAVYIGGYLVYIKQINLCIKSSLIFYIAMLLLDVIALCLPHSAELILAGSGICNAVYAVIMYRLSGLKEEKVQKGDIKEVLKGGLPLFSNRLMSKLSMFILNIFASRLGTEEYAVLSVGRRALEIGQTCVNPVVTLSVINFRGLGLTFKQMFQKLKNVFIVASGVFVFATTVALIVIKGDLTLGQLTQAFTINFLSLFAYIAWVLVESKMTIDNLGRLLVGTGIIRIIVLFILCGISTIEGAGLITLLLYSFISDFLVAAYGYIGSKTKRKECKNAEHM